MKIDTKDLLNITERKPLTPQQEQFCRLYITKGDMFSNGTIAYSIAYRYDLENADIKREIGEDKQEIKGTSQRDRMYAVCQSGASRLLLNENIQARVRELLMILFDDDAVADARLQEIVLSGKDADAINAIKHRSDLKARITKKLDITTQGRPLGNLTDAELEAIAGK